MDRARSGARHHSLRRWIWASASVWVKVIAMHDDEEIRPKKHVLVDMPPLDPLSVDDLQGYIADLKAEISRAEAAIGKKQGAKGHADSFFKF